MSSILCYSGHSLLPKLRVFSLESPNGAHQTLLETPPTLLYLPCHLNWEERDVILHHSSDLHRYPLFTQTHSKPATSWAIIYSTNWLEHYYSQRRIYCLHKSQEDQPSTTALPPWLETRLTRHWECHQCGGSWILLGLFPTSWYMYLLWEHPSSCHFLFTGLEENDAISTVAQHGGSGVSRQSKAL